MGIGTGPKIMLPGLIKSQASQFGAALHKDA